jgi:hypothetical protein
VPNLSIVSIGVKKDLKKLASPEYLRFKNGVIEEKK